MTYCLYTLKKFFWQSYYEKWISNNITTFSPLVTVKLSTKLLKPIIADKLIDDAGKYSNRRKTLSEKKLFRQIFGIELDQEIFSTSRSFYLFFVLLFVFFLFLTKHLIFSIIAFYLTALDSPNVMVKSEVFELMSVLCIYSNDGYQSTLNAIDLIKVSTFGFLFFFFSPPPLGL